MERRREHVSFLGAVFGGPRTKMSSFSRSGLRRGQVRIYKCLCPTTTQEGGIKSDQVQPAKEG